MSSQRPLYVNSAIRRRWGAAPNHQGWLEVQRLRSLLETERARRLEEQQKVASLQRELDSTKSELQKQRNLKEIFIRKGKEMKRELLAVEKFTDPETLRPAAVASMVHSEIRHKKKKLLKQEFEQLKIALMVNEEEFMSHIQAGKERCDTLQEELDQVKTRYEELRSKYEAHIHKGKLQVDTEMFYEEKLRQDQELFENVTDLSAPRQNADAYQHEKEGHLKTPNNDLELTEELRAEKDSLNQRMAQEFTFLQQESEEARKRLQSELEQIKVSYQQLKAAYERDVSALREQAQIFKQGVDKEIKALSQNSMRALKIINDLGAEKDNLQKQLSAFQQMYSTRELSYQTELENLKTAMRDREELGPRRRKVAKCPDPNEKDTTPVNNISDLLLEETLSEDFEVPDASPEELSDLIEGILRDAGILDFKPLEVTDLCEETLSEERERPDPEPMEATDPSTKSFSSAISC
ncbi:cingulin-like protein 1 [Gambusia affinis]|uniref:cingulin-like protein 1 n=1 Tax=Gambusia affinis TaxID=33528 RepID=UPI001CDD0687|nr:cingulin-like protein 1 [Gambusia affinis]